MWYSIDTNKFSLFDLDVHYTRINSYDSGLTNENFSLHYFIRTHIFTDEFFSLTKTLSFDPTSR